MEKPKPENAPSGGTIDQLCRENDINIAFNQLEVHLHNEKGDEVTEVKRDYKGDDPTPAVG